MASDAIKDELVRLNPDTKTSEWKRRSRAKVDDGIERIFEHEDGRRFRTLETKSGIQAEDVSGPRVAFDRAINDAFRMPFVEDAGYDSWKDLMEDYQWEHAGELLSNSMITGVGPVPDTFYENLLEGSHGPERIYDNLHGLECLEYAEKDGVPGYEMQADRSGPSPWVRVTLEEGVFTLRIIPDKG